MIKKNPMRRSGVSALMLAAIAFPTSVGAQDAGEIPASIEKINSDYQRELTKLERSRLEQLGQLAASQPKDQAESIYRDYFQLAISKGLYAEAEPAAERLLKAGDTPSQIHTLANLINIVAEADRGEYEKSLQSLISAIGEKARQEKDGRDLGLPAASRAAIVDAYYQRLLRGNQYEVARKAMKLVAENAEQPAIRDLATRRNQQLELVGREAPSIVGVDLDGQPFRLEEAKGDVVLVVFWATWCLPVAQELPWLEETYRKYHDQGFRVIGIDVDVAQNSNADPNSVIPAVRRFLIDYNISWPTLLNGQGSRDYARAYSVSEIPANVLIGRDGKVAHLDLVGPRLEKAVGEAVGQKP